MAALSSNQIHWELRAKEARELAEQIADPMAKQAMLDIATNYDNTAKRAEARDAHIPLPRENNGDGQ
jgi:hypothetical protein